MGLFDKKRNLPDDLQKWDKTELFRLKVNVIASLGSENMEKKNYTEAVKNFKEFFQLMAENSFSDLQHLIQPCNFNLALCYSHLRNFEDAEKYWTKFIQLDRSNIDAFNERCNCYFALNKNKEALIDIESALKLNPNRADLYINKGIAFIKLGNKVDAKKALFIAIALGNNDAQEYIEKYC